MEHILYLVDLFLHLDKHLGGVIEAYGVWTYAILWAIVFCETGFVVTPFLPGDSLLFAAGAFAATGVLNLPLLIILLIIAAVLGDAVNYQIGRYMGPKVFERQNQRFLKREHLERTHRFYEKYGGKTIIIARFVPIVRTFAPFLAGVGKMSYAEFALYNVSGALVWVISLTTAGYLFSGLEIVKNNFSIVILAIIVISILPAVFEVVLAKRQSGAAKESA